MIQLYYQWPSLLTSLIYQNIFLGIEETEALMRAEVCRLSEESLS